MSKKLPGSQSPWISTAVGSVGFTIGTETSEAITVACQFKDQSGVDLVAPANLRYYIASDSAGLNYAAAASGGIAGGTDGSLKENVTGINGEATCEADGDLDVVITDNTTRTVYLVFVLPDGTLAVSSAVAFA